MRVVRNFNQDWFFIPAPVEHDTPDDRLERVTLPHTNRRFGRFVDNCDYQFVSTYRKRFRLDEQAAGKRIFLDFDGVMLACVVSLNGRRIGEHKGGYTPFSFELTDQVTLGENVLMVSVDSTEDRAIPPYGNLVDYLTFGGIYRDVRLRMVEQTHIVSAFARPLNVLTSPELECDLEIAGVQPDLRVEATVTDAAGRVIAQQTQAATTAALTLRFAELAPITLWSLEQPTLYTLTLALAFDGDTVDQTVVRFGFRHAEFCPDGRFTLNGEPLKLFGLNRHQTYPYIGAAAPERLQALDADILKHELGCNVVRTSHYAQSPHFLNRCDEIGLLVFEELAGWQHIGDAAWQALVEQDLGAMIERDRNHPAIILWGVRVNELPDNDEFYTRTNALAHDLDPTRQTGGVRNFIGSKLLEDVFTLNDFTEGIQTPRSRPHLITEFAGHMFPTKTWDQEERRIEHALKHARKHNLQMGHAEVAGAIGWCAFDYHTHKAFGSGDRVCYHGVMDIYRLPKFAAYFYRSQKAPDAEIVLAPATNWTMGDRSGGGNNPLVVFSNCEEIEVIVGDRSYGRFQPDREQYPHLTHPPFTVRWRDPYNPWGQVLGDLTVRGLIGGAVVAERKIDATHLPDHLHVSANTDKLRADGADMARIAVQIEDKYGNVLPYQIRNAGFTLEGSAELIGENPLVLLGGQGAVYLKAGRQAGSVTIRTEVDELPPVEIKLQIGE